MTKLTIQELGTLINLVGQATTTVSQAHKSIDLRDKMMKMAKELEEEIKDKK